MSEMYAVYDIVEDRVLLYKEAGHGPYDYKWVKYKIWSVYTTRHWEILTGENTDSFHNDLIGESRMISPKINAEVKEAIADSHNEDGNININIIVKAMKNLRIVRFDEDGWLDFLDVHEFSSERYEEEWNE